MIRESIRVRTSSYFRVFTPGPLSGSGLSRAELREVMIEVDMAKSKPLERAPRDRARRPSARLGGRPRAGRVPCSRCGRSWCPKANALGLIWVAVPACLRF